MCPLHREAVAEAEAEQQPRPGQHSQPTSQSANPEIVKKSCRYNPLSVSGQRSVLVQTYVCVCVWQNKKHTTSKDNKNKSHVHPTGDRAESSDGSSSSSGGGRITAPATHPPLCAPTHRPHIHSLYTCVRVCGLCHITPKTFSGNSGGAFACWLALIRSFLMLRPTSASRRR